MALTDDFPLLCHAVQSSLLLASFKLLRFYTLFELNKFPFAQMQFVYPLRSTTVNNL